MTSSRASRLGLLAAFTGTPLSPVDTPGPRACVSQLKLALVPFCHACVSIAHQSAPSAVNSTVLFTALSWQSHPINARWREIKGSAFSKCFDTLLVSHEVY